MGNNGIVVDAVARLQNVSFLAVDYLHLACHNNDKFLALMRGKFFIPC